MIPRSRIGKPHFNHFGFALPFLLIVVQFFLSTPVCADDIEDIYGKLKKELPKDEDVEWIKKFNMTEKYITNLNKIDKDLQRLNLSAEVGFDGHRAGDEGLYKLNVETEITRGVYPHSFRFRAGTSIQLKNKDLQEEVTSMMVNYDYHLKPWLEVYGFVERFTDSYLSISQRYEIGEGVKFELDFGTTKKIDEEWDKDLSTYEDMYKKACEGYRCYLMKLDKDSTDKKSTTETKLLREQLDTLKDEKKSIKRAFDKKYARLSLGMALSVFSEMEKAEIVKKFKDKSIPVDKDPISLDGEQRFRITLRPSVVFRPTDTLTLMLLKYYKLPLGNPLEDKGRSDYRTDSLVRVELKLPVVSNWAKNVSLVIEYQRHYDNLPPKVPSSVYDEYLAEGKELLKSEAEDTHDEFKFKLKILF